MTPSGFDYFRAGPKHRHFLLLGLGMSACAQDDATQVPVHHRAEAIVCDNTRPSVNPGAPSDGDAATGVECRSHEDCTDGDNGQLHSTFADRLGVHLR